MLIMCPISGCSHGGGCTDKPVSLFFETGKDREDMTTLQRWSHLCDRERPKVSYETHMYVHSHMTSGALLQDMVRLYTQ